MNPDVKDLAARRWFGYGRWDAPYWFVGMEPGGDDDHASYETWLALDPQHGGLIDCRAHHEASNVAAGKVITHWHDAGTPPIQSTLGPLIRTLLSFEGAATDDQHVAHYQRDRWGSLNGDTAVIELSALHARNLGQHVDRTTYRPERIADIRSHLQSKERGFALFYGLTYEDEYAKIAGGFGKDGCLWNGATLCVLVVHPAYRFAPGPDYWIELGRWLKAAVDAGPDRPIPERPAVPPSARKAARRTPRFRKMADIGQYPILNNGVEVGRVLYDGWNVRVEQRLPTGEYRLLGHYERSRPAQVERKIAEISSVFDDWCKAPVSTPVGVKANWRSAQFVPNFTPPNGCIDAGCAVLEENRIPFAYVYKTRDGRAEWRTVPAT